MDLRQLEIFVKVAELGSFSRAAEALFLTQPTVSEHIRTLEDELGVRLLDRLGRGAAVTKGGELLLSHAQRMLALAREARQAMESFQGRMSGELLVGASTIPGEYILPALIGRFKEKFPDIAITLLIGDSQAVTEWVAEGRAELGVVGARSAHRGIEFRELMPDDIVLIVSSAHPWHGRKHVTLEELRGEPLLLRERGSGTRAALETARREAGADIATFRVVGEMGSTQAIKQAVKASVGVSLLSRRAVEEECRAGSLWCLRVRDLKITRAFHLATHRERSRSPLAEAFRAFVEAEAV
ncbi:MAG TPA: selenium metabolism-associated LysR family transcriptional regulator [Methylomirabilota bacterium]|nr:selenium metabolism-associated LysR family transcriptional regulator [Methylomirabilota bacterium]